MPFTTLIGTDDLAHALGDPLVAVVDCRFLLNDPGWGERVYEDGHIPGAVYAHLDRHLSGAMSGRNGRHPLPDPRALASTFGALGIDRSVQVVAYDQSDGSFASRLWWLLRWMGHDRVAVLDGGFAKWIDEERPTTPGLETRGPRAFVGEPVRDLLLDADAVQAVLGNPAWRLIDARAPERYRGEIEPIDKIAGHIPGAVNHYFKETVDARGRSLGRDALRAQLTRATGEVPPDHVICYCGSGVNACRNILAFEHAGLSGSRLYAGSWSEWSSDPNRPVEKK